MSENMKEDVLISFTIISVATIIFSTIAYCHTLGNDTERQLGHPPAACESNQGEK